jgi:HD-GYP domain-containing protein (c-di-GMP phosphodiesterase class II)
MDTAVLERIELMETAFVEHEDGNLFLQLADAYHRAGDSDRALGVLRKGLDTHPAFTPAFALLGEVLRQTGRHEEAAVCFEQLLELDPTDARAREALESIAHALSRPVRMPAEAAPSPATAPPAGQPDADANAVVAEPMAAVTAPMPWEESAHVAELTLQAESTSQAGRAAEPQPAEPRPHGDPARELLPHESEPAGADTDTPQPDDRPRSTPQPPTRPHGDPLREHVAPDSLAATLAAANGRPLLAGASADSMAVALADLLVGLLEYRDPFFRGGTSMTRLLAAAIAHEMSLDEATVDAIALGAVLRDLGQIPLKGLIDKPGVELGADGRRKLERHVDTALELLDAVRMPAATRDTIRHHHERWDGTGYPDALAGEAIPLGARIVTVADSFAAMIAARPHRLPKRVPAALEDIRAGASTQYDPAVVDALVRVLSGGNWRGLRFGLRHHVLVVDPDETRAMVMATKLCSHGYLAEAAFTVETARERLDRTRIVGMIVSGELPVGEADALLHDVREAERHGMIPIIVSEAGITERVALLDAGADVCLGRGTSFEELKATLEAFLRREGKPVPAGASRPDAAWAGLQGDIEDFPLSWLLQVLNYDSRTAAVFITGAGDAGTIYLDRGNPRHARTRDLIGEDAFRTMLNWPHGSFSVDPDATTDEQTIRSSLMNLLLEQAVADDHAAFFGAVKV